MTAQVSLVRSEDDAESGRQGRSPLLTLSITVREDTPAKGRFPVNIYVDCEVEFVKVGKSHFKQGTPKGIYIPSRRW
jgi:hypothetical protein